MLAQRRGQDLGRGRTRDRGGKSQADSGTATAHPKRKLSFKEKHALETLPKTMAALMSEIGVLQRKLSDPNLYSRDNAKFTSTSKRLAAAEAEHAAAEEQWLALEIQREEVEGRG